MVMRKGKKQAVRPITRHAHVAQLAPALRVTITRPSGQIPHIFITSIGQTFKNMPPTSSHGGLPRLSRICLCVTSSVQSCHKMTQAFTAAPQTI